jgi:anti-anti-sigma regulatory factor
VLRIDGDIDISVAPQIRQTVTGLAGNGTVHIIADLRGQVPVARAERRLRVRL